MQERQIVLKGKIFSLSKPAIMGILNVSADSFYSGSYLANEKELIEKAEQMLQEGADILDIGAVSTRLGANLLSIEEELKILDTSFKSLVYNFPDAVFSLDTVRSDVVKKMHDKYGISMINDISGGQIDDKMFETVADLQLPYILMHIRGTPANMQSLTDYNNLKQDIFYFFSERIKKLHLLGVNDIIIDPGFGFAKTLDQNYELMACLKEFEIFNKPILVGISRKTLVWKLLDINPDQSLNGTSVLNAFSLLNGANILRVHDVKEAKETIEIIEKLKSSKI
ncbi:MAG: dihydropteroate synthase [Bacteroidales bacterium]|nr:dihydropteroate synthase [Bacteroidales bacterium]